MVPMIDDFQRIYDISLPVITNMPVWPGSQKFSLTWVKKEETDGVNESHISLNSHTGTHIDMPYHFMESGKRVGDILLNRLMGKAAVVEHFGAEAIGIDFLSTVTLPAGCTKLLFKTRNSSCYSSGQDKFREDYIALSPAGAEWFVRNGIDLVGIDSLSIQSFTDKENLVHKMLLGNNIIILEGLCLRDVSRGVYELIVLPLNIPEAEAAPARAILLKGGM
jgi:arylformamidase